MQLCPLNFVYQSLQLGHSLGGHEFGDRNLMFPFSILVPRVPHSVGICLCWGPLHYLKTYTVWTIWPFKSSQLHSGVNHWRNEVFFHTGGQIGLIASTGRGMPVYSTSPTAPGKYGERLTLVKSYLAVFRTKLPIVSFTVHSQIQTCR